MAFPRRQFLHGAAASLGLSALPRLACAQLYPSDHAATGYGITPDIVLADPYGFGGLVSISFMLK